MQGLQKSLDIVVSSVGGPSQYAGCASSSLKINQSALTLCAMVKVPTPPPQIPAQSLNHSDCNSLFRVFAP